MSRTHGPSRHATVNDAAPGSTREEGVRGRLTLTIDGAEIGDGLIVVWLPPSSPNLAAAPAIVKGQRAPARLIGRRLRDLPDRVSRREAAKILATSYENVRRMQRKHILSSGVPDERGHFWLARKEVEELASLRREPRAQLLHSVPMRELARESAALNGKPKGAGK